MASERADLVRNLWARITEGELPLDLCHEDAEIHNPPQFPVRGVYRGHEGFRQWRDDSFDVIDEFRMDVEGVEDLGDGERVLAFLRMRGVAAHTRIPVDETWAAIMTVRDGRLLRAEGYLSRREAKRAAGLRD